MTTDIKELTLTTLAEGAAAELWQAAYQAVLENLADPNTDAKAGRRIALDFTFRQDEHREEGQVEIRCATKLAGMVGVKTRVGFGKHQGRNVAVEFPKQVDLFPMPEARPRPVSKEA